MNTLRWSERVFLVRQERNQSLIFLLNDIYRLEGLKR